MVESDIPILDLSYLNDATGGDSDFISELLQEFQQELDGLYQGLNKALITQEKEKLVRFAHTIKGASANLGAQRIRLLATRLETMARAADFGEFEVASPQLGKEILALQKATADADIPELLRTGRVL